MLLRSQRVTTRSPSPGEFPLSHTCSVLALAVRDVSHVGNDLQVPRSLYEVTQ